MRFSILLISFFVLYSTLIVRMIYIQNNPYNITKHVLSTRYNIYDRNKITLAYTLYTKSAYINPSQISEPALSLYAYHFPDMISQIIENKNKTFIWLKRHLTNEEITNISSLYIPGLHICKDQKRIYPHNHLGAHVIGFCDKNNIGKQGAEYAFQQTLQKSNVHLSLDIRAQYILDNQIQKAVDSLEAEGGAGILINLQGEILAMSSYPFVTAEDSQTFIKHMNRCVIPFEVGSILKIHNIAMLLNSKTATLNTEFDARGTFKVGRFEIQDLFGQNRILTLRESALYSSNIATAKSVLLANSQLQRNFFEKIGFMQSLEWMPKHIAKPLLPKQWSESLMITASYGYGIGISALHLIQSMLRLITGTNININIQKFNSATKSILPDSTVSQIRTLLQEIVEKGHGSRAKVSKLSVGAKTGTANICVNGKYIENQNHVSFVSVFPIQNPKYILLLQMTKPKVHKLRYGKYATASNVLGEHIKKCTHDIWCVLH